MDFQSYKCNDALLCSDVPIKQIFNADNLFLWNLYLAIYGDIKFYMFIHRSS